MKNVDKYVIFIIITLLKIENITTVMLKNNYKSHYIGIKTKIQLMNISQFNVFYNRNIFSFSIKYGLYFVYLHFSFLNERNLFYNWHQVFPDLRNSKNMVFAAKDILMQAILVSNSSFFAKQNEFKPISNYRSTTNF